MQFPFRFLYSALAVRVSSSVGVKAASSSQYHQSSNSPSGDVALDQPKTNFPEKRDKFHPTQTATQHPWPHQYAPRPKVLGRSASNLSSSSGSTSSSRAGRSTVMPCLVQQRSAALAQLGTRNNDTRLCSTSSTADPRVIGAPSSSTRTSTEEAVEQEENQERCRSATQTPPLASAAATGRVCEVDVECCIVQPVAGCSTTASTAYSGQHHLTFLQDEQVASPILKAWMAGAVAQRETRPRGFLSGQGSTKTSFGGSSSSTTPKPPARQPQEMLREAAAQQEPPASTFDAIPTLTFSKLTNRLQSERSTLPTRFGEQIEKNWPPNEVKVLAEGGTPATKLLTSSSGNNTVWLPLRVELVYSSSTSSTPFLRSDTVAKNKPETASTPARALTPAARRLQSAGFLQTTAQSAAPAGGGAALKIARSPGSFDVGSVPLSGRREGGEATQAAAGRATTSTTQSKFLFFGVGIQRVSKSERDEWKLLLEPIAAAPESPRRTGPPVDENTEKSNKFAALTEDAAVWFHEKEEMLFDGSFFSTSSERLAEFAAFLLEQKLSRKGEDVELHATTTSAEDVEEDTSTRTSALEDETDDEEEGEEVEEAEGTTMNIKHSSSSAATASSGTMAQRFFRAFLPSTWRRRSDGAVKTDGTTGTAADALTEKSEDAETESGQEEEALSVDTSSTAKSITARILHMVESAMQEKTGDQDHEEEQKDSHHLFFPLDNYTPTTSGGLLMQGTTTEQDHHREEGSFLQQQFVKDSILHFVRHRNAFRTAESYAAKRRADLDKARLKFVKSLLNNSGEDAESDAESSKMEGEVQGGGDEEAGVLFDAELEPTEEDHADQHSADLLLPPCAMIPSCDDSFEDEKPEVEQVVRKMFLDAFSDTPHEDASGSAFEEQLVKVSPEPQTRLLREFVSRETKLRKALEGLRFLTSEVVEKRANKTTSAPQLYRLQPREAENCLTSSSYVLNRSCAITSTTVEDVVSVCDSSTASQSLSSAGSSTTGSRSGRMSYQLRSRGSSRVGGASTALCFSMDVEPESNRGEGEHGAQETGKNTRGLQPAPAGAYKSSGSSMDDVQMLSARRRCPSKKTVLAPLVLAAAAADHCLLHGAVVDRVSSGVQSGVQHLILQPMTMMFPTTSCPTGSCYLSGSENTPATPWIEGELCSGGTTSCLSTFPDAGSELVLPEGIDKEKPSGRGVGEGRGAAGSTTNAPEAAREGDQKVDDAVVDMDVDEGEGHALEPRQEVSAYDEDVDPDPSQEITEDPQAARPFYRQAPIWTSCTACVGAMTALPWIASKVVSQGGV